MLEFLFPSWRSQKQDDLEAGLAPSTSRAVHSKKSVRRNGRNGKLQPLNTTIISAPMPLGTPSSLTGFDVPDYPQHSPSSTRSGRSAPPHVAWLRSVESANEEEQMRVPIIYPPPPAVVRLDEDEDGAHPIMRSWSSPAPYTSVPAVTPRRQGSNPNIAGNTHSLRLEGIQQYSMIPYGVASYSYPLMKPLSPIAEQDYFSPESLRRTVPLPPASETNTSISTSGPSPPAGTPSPPASLASEATAVTNTSARPSPVHAHPFISRTVNRSLSQTSHRSTNSNVSKSSWVAPNPPILPPLDLRPPFPGPHPSGEGQLRPKKSGPIQPLPTIEAGSSEDDLGDEQSFVTASDSSPVPQSRIQSGFSIRPPPSDIESASPPRTTLSLDYGDDIHYPDDPVYLTYPDHPDDLAGSGPDAVPQHAEDAPRQSQFQTGSSALLPHTPHSPQGSPSESFIGRRWERSASLGPGRRITTTFRVKPRLRYRLVHETTPAFWAFWLGFVCPVLWLVGGWHFTRFGEQPIRVGVWEYYFKAKYWREKLCCLGRSKKPGMQQGEEEEGKGKLKQNDSLRIPKWISEKQSSDMSRARLNDPKRSLKGIASFGYPFIPRPAQIEPQNSVESAFVRLGSALGKTNKFWDQVHGVKLTSVQGKTEARRRMFDPWIQRCRYAFCYGVVVICAALGTGAVVLLVLNTKGLR